MAPDPRPARTRSRVLDATWELLTEVGFEGVTVELVSDRSGVARSTLYRHWRTKEELLRDAFAAQARDGQRLDAADGLAALTDYASALAHGLTAVWGRAALSLAASAWDDPPQEQVLQVFVQGTRRDLADVVAGALERGQLPPQPVEDAVERLVDEVVAPLFYRYLVRRAPTAQDAARLAREAWERLGGQPA